MGTKLIGNIVSFDKMYCAKNISEGDSGYPNIETEGSYFYRFNCAALQDEADFLSCAIFATYFGALNVIGWTEK